MLVIGAVDRSEVALKMDLESSLTAKRLVDGGSIRRRLVKQIFCAADAFFKAVSGRFERLDGRSSNVQFLPIR